MPTNEPDCTFRPPTADDGLRLYELIRACPPLDVNTVYAYHLIVRHFAATSIVVEQDGALIGAVTGYRLPDDPAVLFVWQVAVAEAGRGRGLATRMLHALVDRCPGVRRMHTTIGPDNIASRRSFEKLAARLDAPFTYTPFLSAADCGPGHDPEDLLSIGEFTPQPTENRP